MNPINSSMFKLARKCIMIIGIGLFILFAYKASHDVSNPAIAAGSLRDVWKPMQFSQPSSLLTQISANNQIPVNTTASSDAEKSPEGPRSNTLNENDNNSENLEHKNNTNSLQYVDSFKKSEKKS